MGLAVLTLALVTGCASAPGVNRSKVDPFEPMNRAVFSFNDAIDGAVVKPVARKYVEYVHPGFRGLISNFFGNLGDAWTSVNQLLQGKPYWAFTDASRFFINSTFGILGFVDLAGEFGIEKHKEDFGQTLGRWGVGAGPYLVLPVLGMSTVRDTVGLVPDYFGNPLSYMDQDSVRWTLFGVNLISVRASLLPAEAIIEGGTLDKYVAFRNAYLQRRRNQVYDGDPPDEPDDDPPAESNSDASGAKSDAKGENNKAAAPK